MKKYCFLWSFITTSALLCHTACQTDRMIEQIPIKIEHPVAGTPLRSILDFKGLTVLQTNDMEGIDRVRGMDKILFNGDRIVVLDNATDFESIWIFDAQSGRRTGSIPYKNANSGLQDIALLPNGHICCLAADKRAFIEYDLQGNIQSKLDNGVIGDLLVCQPDRQYLVYNEYSATEVSGYYQLLFFDHAGNLVDRLYPYNKEIDNNGYGMTGFLSASGGQTWFSPPFCDTVYEIVQRRLIPRYVFDYGAAAVPEQLRRQKLSGWDVDGNAYLCERFIKTGPFVLFKHYADNRMNTSLFDERTKAYFRFRDAGQDFLYELLWSGDIFPKDDNTFAFLLTPARIAYMLKQNLLDLDGIKQYAPTLYAALTTSQGVNPNPILLYFSFRPGVSISEMNRAKG